MFGPFAAIGCGGWPPINQRLLVKKTYNVHCLFPCWKMTVKCFFCFLPLRVVVQERERGVRTIQITLNIYYVFAIFLALMEHDERLLY